MINIVLIFCCLVAVLWFYRKGYYPGLNAAVFLLVLCPNNMAIEISMALPSITIHRILIMVMLLMLCTSEEVELKIRDVPFLKTFVFIALAMVASTALSINFVVSFKRYLYFIVETVIFYIIMSSSIRTRENAVGICRTISASLMIVALLGIVEKYTNINPTTYLGIKKMYDFEVMRYAVGNDVTATYIHRILFGTAMAVGLMNSIYLVDLSDDTKKKYLCWLYILAMGTALYFSMSRGPWLAFILSCVMITFLFYRPIVKKIMLIGAAALLILLLRPGVFQTIGSLYSVTHQEESIKGSSYQWRYIVFETAYKNIVHSRSWPIKLFGNGEDAHHFKKVEPVMLPTGHLSYFTSWDNEYAVILYERGMIGLLCILFIYGIYSLKSVIYYFRNEENIDIVLMALSCVVIIFIMNFSVKIFAPQIVYLQYMYISIGCLFVYGDKNKEEDIPVIRYCQ